MRYHRRLLSAVVLALGGAGAFAACESPYPPAEGEQPYPAGRAGPPASGSTAPGGGERSTACESLYGGVCLPVSEIASCPTALQSTNACAPSAAPDAAASRPDAAFPYPAPRARDAGPPVDAFFGFDGPVFPPTEFDASFSSRDAAPEAAIVSGTFCCIMLPDAGSGGAIDAGRPDVVPAL